MESTLHITQDLDGILTVRMDVPGKSVNACTPAFLDELNETIDRIETDRPKGVIFASAKPRSFNAGADLFEIRKMSPEQISAYLALGQALFNRIAHLPMPTVAAINGDCLGGGFELALACKYRVAADDPAVSIGLPEVKLGLIPAWGGTTRLPRKIGLSRALPILLAGKTMPPRKALKVGLIDEVVRREALLSAANRLAQTHPHRHRPSFFDGAIARFSFLRQRVLEKAKAQTLASTYGNYPAPLRLLEVIETAYAQGFAMGLEAERKALLELSSGDTGRNLLRLFFLRQAAKHNALEQVHGQSSDLTYAAVIGGGTMGAGIVHALIKAGLFVRLVEVDAQAVSGALGRVQKMLDDDVSSGRLDKLAVRHAMNKLSPTTDWTGVELADFVIEAVAETLDSKRDVFHRLDRMTQPHAVLASNTSSLRIDDIAQATLHPERVIGLHFFNPVSKMPLVEIVRTAHSDDASLATAIGLVGRIGKTPVLVQDAPGFLVNRMLIPCLAEALTMADEGTSIVTIDDTMKHWGMPMGPFELLDEIGLDIAGHVFSSLSDASSLPSALAEAIKHRWLGKKSGRGFYEYAEGKTKGPLPANEELLKPLIPNDPAAMSSDESEAIQWRLVMPMINETAKLLDEQVTDSTDTVDLATVLGLGLAPFRGGLVHYADAIGSDEIVRRLDDLRQKHGARFAPARLLRDLAAHHRLLSQYKEVERSIVTAGVEPHPVGTER